MNVNLTPELESFVHRKVESGLYGSASEVVREALRLLARREAAERVDELLLEGFESGPGEPADRKSFDRLHATLRPRGAKRRRSG